MTYEELIASFVYEDRGMLRKIKNARKPYPWRGIGKGSRYLVTTFIGRVYYLHRLVWQYHTGQTPSQIDHIDGDFRNNRIENLRECTAAQNQYNSPRKTNNKSGFKGVVYVPKCKHRPWHAKIATAGKVIGLGYYETPELAAEAYARGAAKLAGEFARADA